jgi:hypothetical protein
MRIVVGLSYMKMCRAALKELLYRNLSVNNANQVPRPLRRAVRLLVACSPAQREIRRGVHASLAAARGLVQSVGLQHLQYSTIATVL